MNQQTITKHYLSHPFLSHSIIPLTGTNLPTGIQDPGDEQPENEEEERNRREELKENQAEL